MGRGTLAPAGPAAVVKLVPPLWPGFCLELPQPSVVLTVVLAPRPVATQTTSGDGAGPQEIPR